MSDMNYAGSNLIFELEDHPPSHQALVGVIIHLLAVSAPMVAPTLIVGAALQLSAETTAYLVSMVMIASGIDTWSRVNRYSVVGSGLLSIQSVNFSLITVMIVLGSSMENDGFHGELIMPSLLGVSSASAFLVVRSSFILPYLHRVIIPTVSDIVVLMIGLSLIKAGIIDFGGGFAAKSSGTFGNYEHLDVGLLILIAVIDFNCHRGPLLRIGRIAIGLCVGYTTSLCPGTVNFSNMHSLPPITIPYPSRYGFSFNFHRFLVVGTIYLLSVPETVGDIIATAVVPRRLTQGKGYQSRLESGVLADGLVSVIASIVDSLPLVMFAQNNEVVRMTGVASRYIEQTIAAILIIFGLFPMIGNPFMAIPSVVLGDVMTLMFSMIVTTETRIIITNSLKRRKILIVATSLGLGLGVSYDPGIFKILPVSIYALVENSIYAGRLTVILLDIILPGGCRQENVLPGITSAEEMD